VLYTIEQFRIHNEEHVKMQKSLESMENYYNTSYEDMYVLYHIMKQKSAEKFIEGWVAYQTNTKKKDALSYDKKNDIEGLDLGDLVTGTTLVPGKNNIELKVSFSSGDSVGGGQLRFYEPVAGYLFMKAWNSKTVEYFYLTKNELIAEIRQRATTPIGKDKNGKDKFYTALGSSQGSGKIKGDNFARLQILQENLDQKRQDQIGWNFNAKTEPEFYKSWQTKYLKSIEELKEIFKKMSNAI
jgi:hypothetical protein